MTIFREGIKESKEIQSAVYQKLSQKKSNVKITPH